MHHLSGYMSDGFAYRSPYGLAPVLPLTGTATLLRLSTGSPTTPSVPAPASARRHRHARLASGIQPGRPNTGTGISTRCPSTTPVGLALGPDSPWADWPGPGTLGLTAGKVLTCLIATHACILTPPHSTTGHPVASRNGGRSPTQPCGCRGFGGVLEPRYIIGAQSLDQ